MSARKTSPIGRMDKRLALSFGALTLCLLLIVIIASSYLFISMQSRQEDRLAGTLARILGESISRVSFSGTYHARLFVEEIKAKTSEIESISVESRDGRVIAHSDPARNDSTVSAGDLEMIATCLATNKTVVAPGTSPHGKARKVIVLPYAGGVDHEAMGVVRLTVNTDDIRREQQSGIVIMVIAAAALSLVALIAILVLSRHFGATVRELAAQLQTVLDNSPALIYMKDLQGRYLFVNMTWLRLFDKSIENVIGRNDHELFPEDVACRLVENDHAAMKSGEPLDVEEQAPLDDGIHYYQSIKVAIRDSAGDIHGVCGISTDITARKNAAEELRNTNEMFSLFMRYSPVYVFIKEVTPDCSRVLQASDNFQDMVGIRGPDMVGKTMEDLFPPDFAAKITADDRDVVARGSVLKIDEELNGRYYTTIKFPLVHGDRVLLAGFTIDITERKLAEEALHESDVTFRKLFEESSDPILLIDSGGVFVECNQAALDLLKMSREQFIFLPPVRISPEFQPNGRRSDEAALDMIEQAYRKGLHRFDWTCVNAEGGEFIVEVSLMPISIRGQTMLHTTWRDITERKRNEERRKLSEEKFASIFNLMPDMVGITRMSDGCFIEVNDGFERGTGWAREEALGKTSLELGVWNQEDRAKAVAVLQQQGHLEAFEFTMRKRSGELRAALMYLLPIVVHDQKCLFFMARDVTDFKQAVEDRIEFEKQLLHAQKLESLGVLAGGIAHDFNNLLMAIMGNADLALMRLNPESPAVDNLKRIEQASAKAADLAKQMLAYSGKGKFIVEHLDLNRLLEEMLHMLEVSISKKAVLRFNLTYPLPSVEADATQLRQIVMNLVINASEAIGDNSGLIAISTGFMECSRSYLKEIWLDENLPDGLYVYLEVTDTGCGMDKDTLSKLFDPFFTTKFTGRGLGMAAVLGIVRGHKGAIKVCSEPGKGTSFKVLLPACNRPAELSDGESHEDGWKGAGTVLLVDDEESVRGIGREMLEELGFSVITADDGFEGVRVFDKNPDVAFVILDLTMPHMDGEQCFRELRRLRPDLKVIMSSGYSEQDVSEKFTGTGLAGFIQKPYKMSALREAIRKIFDDAADTGGTKR